MKDYCEKNNVIFLPREPKLAQDDANGNDLMNFWVQNYPKYDYYFQLFATSPFLKPSTIYECVKALKEAKEEDSIFTANEKCGWYWFQGKPINYDPKVLPRSQDAKKVICETTGLYGIIKQSLIENKCRIGKLPQIYLISDLESLDIDTEFDFKIAEQAMKMEQEEC